MSLTEEQQAERHAGLGGSDAAPALGLSPYKSALELFLEKRQPYIASPVHAAALHWGALLEPVIRQEYATRTGRVVRVPGGTLRHPRHTFMVAHVDGVTDDSRLFEAKTARSDVGWGRPGTDEVPHHYLLQVQHYLAIVGFAVADVAVLIGGNDFRIYEVPADEGLQEMIIEAEAEFWQLVESGTAPPPDWESADVAGLMRRLYPGTDGSTVIATESDCDHRRVYKQAAEMERHYRTLADTAKAQLLYVMGNAARMIFPDEGMQLQRKEIARKEHTVPATKYIDARFSKLKETTQ